MPKMYITIDCDTGLVMPDDKIVPYVDSCVSGLKHSLRDMHVTIGSYLLFIAFRAAALGNAQLASNMVIIFNGDEYQFNEFGYAINSKYEVLHDNYITILDVIDTQ